MTAITFAIASVAAVMMMIGPTLAEPWLISASVIRPRLSAASS